MLDIFNSFQILDIALIITAYLVGSVTAGRIICKIFKLQDPTTLGSKNPGATNVFRLGGKLPAIITLFLDLFKGFVVVFLALKMNLEIIKIAFIAFAVFCGHIWPFWFKFKGGKGVATSVGILLAIYSKLAVISILIWCLTFILTKISALSAVIAALVTFICVWSFSFNISYACLITFMVVILLIKHTDNIKRILNGQEKIIKF